MPLTLLSGEGIELPLSEYNRLRAFQGGGWFWDHENQQVIREVLGDFLPRVEERSKGRNGGAVAFFQFFTGGSEAAGKSAAVGAKMNRVPRTEYLRLQRSLETLKSKAQNPHTDPNARRVIEKFCLPDPAQNPELYRLHGSAWNRRLLVLWGCEREQGTSLAPEDALHKISVEPPVATFLRRLPLLLGLLLLLLLLALLTIHFWPRHENEPPERNSPSVTAQDAFDSRSTAVPGVRPPETGSSSSTPASTLAALPGATAAGEAQSTDASTPIAAETSSRAGAASPHESAGTKQDSSETSPTPGSSLNRPAASGQAPASSSPAPQASIPAPRAAPSSRTADASPSPDDPSAASPALKPSSPAEQAVRAAVGSTPSVAASVPPTGAPPRLEILHAPTSTPPHDGKLDLVLMATAHETDGSLATVAIHQWKVDGQPQQDRLGQDVTNAQLALTLPPGKHRVSFFGTARGLPVECAAEVNVQIKSQGDVTVKSGPGT